MKMITAIVNKEDSSAVCHALTKNGFSVTKLPTQGGFLMAGNMTLLIGTDDEKVDQCLELIASCAKQRTEVVPSSQLWHWRYNGISAGSDGGRRNHFRHQCRAL